MIEQYLANSSADDFDALCARTRPPSEDARAATKQAAAQQKAADAQGSGLISVAGLTSGDTANVAINFGKGDVTCVECNNVHALGFGNLAANIGGAGTTTNPTVVAAFGLGNAAVNVGGSGNVVAAGTGPNPATLSAAFNLLGTNNFVQAGPGPLAVAGALGGTGKVVTQTGPGINIG